MSPFGRTRRKLTAISYRDSCVASDRARAGTWGDDVIGLRGEIVFDDVINMSAAAAVTSARVITYVQHVGFPRVIRKP